MAKLLGALERLPRSRRMPPRREAAAICVFLDRDGVINRKQPEDDYVKRWEEFEFLPGAIEALRLLARAGCRTVVVTYQRGIALGRMTAEAVDDIHARMRHALAEAGARIEAVYYCPHDNGSCDCRKPGTGLFLRATRELPGVDFSRAIVIGDSVKDMQAGARLGCRTVLIADAETAAGRLDELTRQGLAVAGCVGSLLEAVVQHVIRPSVVRG